MLLRLICIIVNSIRSDIFQIEAELDNLASQCADVNLVCSTEYLPGPPLHEGQQLKVFHVSIHSFLCWSCEETNPVTISIVN